jgi:hypothetical protein
MFLKSLDGWNEAIALCGEYNELAAAKDWAAGTFWMCTVGDGTELVGDFDLSDLASLQRENDVQMSDPEAVALWRRFDAVERARHGFGELLETALGAG